jgi:SnoaL-like domain
VNTSGVTADDEREIRALVYRNAYAVSRADADTLANVWAKDCHFELAGVTGDTMVFDGRDTVVDYQRSHMGRYESLIQHPGQGLVWLGPNGPEGHWIVFEVGRWSGATADRIGLVVYSDRYAHEDGQWKFAARQLKVHYNNPNVPAGTYAPLPPLPA